MTKFGMVVMLFSILCWGCKTKKDIVKSKDTVNTEENLVDSETCADPENGLLWVENTEELANKNLVKISADFKLFTVDALKLRQLFEKNVKQKNETFEFGLPVYINKKIACKFFNLRNSETISKGTQVRMGVYSFKGEERNNQLHTGRFDFQANTGLRGYLQLADQTYIFEPVIIGGGRYYISYNKKNSNAIKKQFELK